MFAKADFAPPKLNWVTPISTSYRGCDVYQMPRARQRFATLEILTLSRHARPGDFDVAKAGAAFGLPRAGNRRMATPRWIVDFGANMAAASDSARFTHRQNTDRVDLQEPTTT